MCLSSAAASRLAVFVLLLVKTLENGVTANTRQPLLAAQKLTGDVHVYAHGLALCAPQWWLLCVESGKLFICLQHCGILMRF